MRNRKANPCCSLGIAIPQSCRPAQPPEPGLAVDPHTGRWIFHKDFVFDLEENKIILRGSDSLVDQERLSSPPVSRAWRGRWEPASQRRGSEKRASGWREGRGFINNSILPPPWNHSTVTGCEIKWRAGRALEKLKHQWGERVQEGDKLERQVNDNTGKQVAPERSQKTLGCARVCVCVLVCEKDTYTHTGREGEREREKERERSPWNPFVFQPSLPL